MSPDFFFSFFYLFTFKLCKFSISKMFLQQLFLLPLKHKPFLVESALISICRLCCFWSTADSAVRRGTPSSHGHGEAGGSGSPVWPWPEQPRLWEWSSEVEGVCPNLSPSASATLLQCSGYMQQGALVTMAVTSGDHEFTEKPLAAL